MSAADLLLRVVAQVDDAVRNMREVAAATNEADKAAAGAQSRFAQLGSTVAGIGAKAAGSFGALQGIGSVVEQFLGTDTRAAKASQAIGDASSGDDLRKKFNDAITARQTSFTETGGVPGMFKAWGMDIGRALKGDTGYSWEREREATELFGDIARTDPARAQALLAGDLGRQERLRGRFQSILARETAADTFTGSLKDAKPQVQVNIQAGVGDPHQIGADAQAALESFYRQNPHLRDSVRFPGT